MDVKFYCRPSKAGKTGFAPIEMSIVLNGKRQFLNLAIKLQPKEFKKDMASKKENNTKKYCEAMKRNLDRVIVELADSGEPITLKAIREYMRYGGVKPYTVENLFDDYLKLLKLKVGNEIRCSTYDKYVRVKEIFYDFYDKNKQASSVTLDIVEAYYAMLNAKYTKSTAAGLMTKTKVIFRYGFDCGKVKYFPFGLVKISKGKPNKEFLTEEELNTIYNKDFYCDRLNQVRDTFIFQACTGLSYCDIAALEPEDIKYINGLYYIAKERLKNGNNYCTVILPYGVEILKRYNGKIPVLTNQKYNAYLKEIQDICGIKKTLKTHLARKSFATFLVNNGYDYSTIAKMLGHNNTLITQSTYAFLQPMTVLREIVSKPVYSGENLINKNRFLEDSGLAARTLPQNTASKNFY